MTRIRRSGGRWDTSARPFEKSEEIFADGERRLRSRVRYLYPALLPGRRTLQGKYGSRGLKVDEDLARSDRKPNDMASMVDGV